MNRSTRVVKRLSPGAAGATCHLRRFGDTLVCVRYRRDLHGQFRYPTVELIVEQGPIRPSDASIVAVRLTENNSEMRQRLIALGPKWNSPFRLWYVPRRIAKSLHLLDQVMPD